MTLMYELDLDILKMYSHTKKKFMGQGVQKLELEQDRETHRQTRRKTLPRRQCDVVIFSQEQ